MLRYSTMKHSNKLAYGESLRLRSASERGQRRGYALLSASRLVHTSPL